MSTETTRGDRHGGYPDGSVWRSEGFFLASHRSWGILGHRDIKATAVLGPRLLRLFGAAAFRLADELEAAGSSGDGSVRVVNALIAAAADRDADGCSYESSGAYPELGDTYYSGTEEP